MAGVDPLIETLFKSTVTADEPSSSESGSSRSEQRSELPVLRPGTRARGGNTMGRTRAALIQGARQAVQSDGLKISMAQVALSAGVAKATLYNHFRTREAVLQALLEDEIATVLQVSSDHAPEPALLAVGQWLAASELLLALRVKEPAVVVAAAAALLRDDMEHADWPHARSVAQRLNELPEHSVALARHWIAARIVTTPASGDDAQQLSRELAPMFAHALITPPPVGNVDTST